MNLPEYIASIGYTAAAKLFDQSVHTVKSWRYGTRKPSPDAAWKIVEATGGKLSLENIYPRPVKPDTEH